MKIRRKLTSRTEVETDDGTHQQLFDQLQRADEVFSEESCGQCGSKNVTFYVRNSVAKKGKNKGKSFTYYEMKCKDCRSYLEYGQHQNDGKPTGTMYPKRKIPGEGEETVYDTRHRGWKKPTIPPEDEHEAE
jgi:hypothetical protein